MNNNSFGTREAMLQGYGISLQNVVDYYYTLDEMMYLQEQEQQLLQGDFLQWYESEERAMRSPFTHWPPVQQFAAGLKYCWDPCGNSFDWIEMLYPGHYDRE